MNRQDVKDLSPEDQADFDDTLATYGVDRSSRRNGDGEEATDGERASSLPVSDFIAFSPDHTYIHRATGETWTSTAVNARVMPVDLGGGKKPIAASVWLDRNDAVEQRVWSPGDPQIVKDKLVAEGGFFAKPGAGVFNMYKPPQIITSAIRGVMFWHDRLHAIWPDQADHIERWLAHRAQRPGEKINHALVLGGKPGIGKDAVVDVLKVAVGPWNFAEISPQAVLGTFNEFARSVVLRISEGKDLGDVDRFTFYEATKTLIAAPPDTLRIEAESGAHLWADKYDGAFEDVFDLQDRITDSVVGVVEPSVRRSEIERSRRKRPESLDAYDLFLQSLPHMQARMPHGARIAIPLLEKALELDPDYAVAHAHLAWCHEWCFTRGGFDEADKRAALIHAQATIASDTDDAAALAVAGWVTIVLSKEHDMALNAIERALSLNPSCAMAHYYAALTNAFADRPTAVAFHANRALRLSPLDPANFDAHLALGMAAVSEGRFEEAVSCFAKASQINPKLSLLQFFHAIALALSGRAENSAPSVQRGLELEPGFRIRVFSEFGMARPLAEKFEEGARLLALPE